MANETEKLIDLVRENRLIYDLSDSDYKKRDKHAEVWNKISASLGEGNSSDYKRKWRSLRDNYKKYKKNIETETGQAYKKYKSWPWADQMKFLDHFQSERNTSSNFDEQSQSQPIQEDSFETSNASFIEIEDETPTTDIPRSSSKKRKIIDDSTNKILEYLKNKNEKKRQFDEVDHFFLSYAKTFKRLPNEVKPLLKVELATLFAKYEIESFREPTQLVTPTPMASSSSDASSSSAAMHFYESMGEIFQMEEEDL